MERPLQDGHRLDPSLLDERGRAAPVARSGIGDAQAEHRVPIVEARQGAERPAVDWTAVPLAEVVWFEEGLARERERTRDQLDGSPVDVQGFPVRFPSADMDAGDVRRGLVDAAPLLPGIVPFGMVVGLASVEAGLRLVDAVAMSVVVFAGASQLAALDLLGNDAPLAVVVVTATVINLRMLMYSASIASHFRRFSAAWKAGLAYLLTDQAYALSIVEYRRRDDVDRRAYYLAVGITLWATWQVATVAGYLLGTGIPPAWQLDFAVPLVFLAVLVPAVEDRPSLLAAVVGGVVAVLGRGLPLNLGLLVGAAVGIAAGLAAETRTEAEYGD